MELGLKGKKAIITGGSRGIGLHTAILLAQEGCCIAFYWISNSNLVISKTRDNSPKAIPIFKNPRNANVKER